MTPIAAALAERDIVCAPIYVSFADLLAQIAAMKYTGSVTVHFAQGAGVAVDMPVAPIRMRLDRRTARGAPLGEDRRRT